ncbi:MAG: histidine phosphatase family protein [Bryobacterales bacterium]|nr:histidine phosphatase family protein [Bryobacterales bacterium]
MHKIHFFRHGQAGTRDHYDTLSPLGIRQATRLGEYLARRKVHFESAWMGGLERQQQTAHLVKNAYQRLGVPFPELELDPRWSEFDLYAVYQSIAPQMSQADSWFRERYQQMIEELKNPEAAVHRHWTDCDKAVMQAWLTGRFEIDAETFAQFRARVEAALATCCSTPVQGNAAIFTSATPIGLGVARAVGLADGKFSNLVEALYNASWSILRIRRQEPHLFGFNRIPHLDEPELMTFR